MYKPGIITTVLACPQACWSACNTLQVL